jgi:ribonuclease E
MASTAPGLLKTFEDRPPAPSRRRFGTAAWVAAVVLIAAFAVLNYGAGLILDAVLHPAAEPAPAPAEVHGEPASVVVALPPPLPPRAVRASTPAAVTSPVALPRASARRDGRSYRHGWYARRWRETASEPAEAAVAPVTATSHNPSPTNLLAGGLPKRAAGNGEAPLRKEAAMFAPVAPKPSTSAAPPAPRPAAAPGGADKSVKPAAPIPAAVAAPKFGPPAALSSAASN